MKRSSRLFIVGIVVIFALCTLGACSQNSTQYERSHYDIVATLEGHELTISETISYVNDTGHDRDNITLVSYVGAYTRAGTLADTSSPLAYPFGVNYADLDIGSITVNGVETDYRCINEMYIEVPLHEMLHAGGCVDIGILYSESIPKNRLRYGYNETSINLGNAFIRVLPYGAEYTPFATNGDPFYNDVAHFDVFFTCDKNFDVAMTGAYEACECENSNTITYKSSTCNVRDYAIVLSDKMRIVHDRCGDVDIIYMSEREENLVNARLVANVLGVFSRVYGTYPYSTLTVVENDFVEGGMEYPGLIYVTKSARGAEMEKIIVHELAHQWWYGIVGVNENVDYFVDEGMAELSTYIYYMENGEEAYANALAKRIHDDYVMFMARSDKPCIVGKSLASIGNMEYYVAGYIASPLILKNTMDRIGKAEMCGVLRKIQSEYAYKNIDTKTFLSYFGGYGRDMQRYMNGKVIE